MHQQLISIAGAQLAIEEASTPHAIKDIVQQALVKFPPAGSTAPVLTRLLEKTPNEDANDLTSLKSALTKTLQETVNAKAAKLRAADPDPSTKGLSLLLKDDPPIKIQGTGDGN